MKFAVTTKKLFNNTGRIFHPGEVFLIDAQKGEHYIEFPKEGIRIIDPDDLIRPVDCQKDFDYKNLLIICGGGIGDIIAHSVICNYLKDKNIFFVTNKKYFDVFNWFKQDIELIDINDTILKDYNFKTQLTKYNTWRRAKTEWAVVNNNNLDWYHVLLSCINVMEIDSDLVGPQLKLNRIVGGSSNIKEQNSILICNKASCMMRNIEFHEIYNALPERLKKENQIYVHEDNLSQRDILKNFPGVKIIKANSLFDYLLDLYDAGLVITIDSCPIHFREGIHRPAIGLYNSFDKDSRTSFYQYTKSYNIKSECELQPCFKHELQQGDLCPIVKKWQFVAPCFRSRENKYLQKQLKKIFSEIRANE